MRSRYTAYVQGDVDYIIETHDPQTVEGTDRQSAQEWSQGAQWLGLQVLGTERGGADDDDGVVEFIARYATGGSVQAHHERSRFRKERGRWLYVDGQVSKAAPVVRGGAKVGRNDPCPCGSGRKFKKCCGK